MDEVNQDQGAGNFSNNNVSSVTSNAPIQPNDTKKHFSTKGAIFILAGLLVIILVLFLVYKNAAEKRDEAEIRAGMSEERVPVEPSEEDLAEMHTGKHTLDDGHAVTPEEEAEIKSGQNLEN